jgi:hypothetical protein
LPLFTPTRYEATQARLLDVQRILHFWERQQRSGLRSCRQGFARFGRNASERRAARKMGP